MVRSAKGDLEAAIRRAVARGFGPAVTSAMFQCLPGAIYTPTAASHHSLDFEAYAHFTCTALHPPR